MPTKIEWADEAWNSLRARRKDNNKVGWACEKIAPECKNCYAESMNVENGKNPARMGNGLHYSADVWEMMEHYLHAETLTAPLKWKKPKRIFPCSMTDLYGAWVPDEVLDKIYAVMALTPQHTYIVLTKRPDRRLKYLRDLAEQDNVGSRITPIAIELSGNRNALVDSAWPHWPLPNVIEMASFGTQAQADIVAPILAATPAARIGLSCEPLLESLSLPACLLADVPATLITPATRRLSWLILGGESGESARPMDVMWMKALRRQAGSHYIPVFVKQLGRYVLEDGHRIKLREKWKGGDFEEFPETLQWRQEPAEVVA